MATTRRRFVLRGMATMWAALCAPYGDANVARGQLFSGELTVPSTGQPFLCIEIADWSNVILVSIGVSILSRNSNDVIQVFQLLSAKLASKCQVRVALGNGSWACGRFDCHMEWPRGPMIVESHLAGDVDEDEDEECHLPEAKHHFVVELSSDLQEYGGSLEQANCRDVEFLIEAVMHLVDAAEVSSSCDPLALSALATRLRAANPHFLVDELDLCALK